MKDEIMIPNFWPVHELNSDPALYKSELGWDQESRILPGSDDTKDIFDFWIRHMGFSLGMYYVEEDVFLFLWTDYKRVYLLPDDPDWDGKYIFERSIMEEQFVYDLDEIFESDDIETLWNEFRFKGKDLKYLMEHSVVKAEP